MTRKTYRIGIGILLAVIVAASIYLLYREKENKAQHEDGVLVKQTEQMRENAEWGEEQAA